MMSAATVGSRKPGERLEDTSVAEDVVIFSAFTISATLWLFDHNRDRIATLHDQMLGMPRGERRGRSRCVSAARWRSVVAAEDLKSHTTIGLHRLHDKPIAGKPYGSQMPAFPQLSDIAVIIDHERTLRGNRSPIISPDDVKRARYVPGESA